MPYSLYKTNGVKLTTVEDGKLNLTTDLQLVGKNYSGYGESVNSNFIKLLENFSNNSSPLLPLMGQLWYDSNNAALKVYTGTKWNKFVNATISTNRPTDLNNEEFWFDSLNLKLYFKYANTFNLIGPGSGVTSAASSSLLGTSKVTASNAQVYDVLEFKINDSIMAVISPYAFTVDPADELYAKFTVIKRGVTLFGANATTGISSSNSTFLWGTAADSVRFNGQLATEYLLQSDRSSFSSDITRLNNITYISAGSPSTTGQFDGKWTLTSGSTLESTYADIAERYEADNIYYAGTVLVIGGQKEVTTTTKRANTSIAGIVSTDPAYTMNSSAGNSETHPYIALKGRVPCQVYGPINKGDLLVTSTYPGYACAWSAGDDSNAVLGRALENFSADFGIIEVMVD